MRSQTQDISTPSMPIMSFPQTRSEPPHPMADCSPAFQVDEVAWIPPRIMTSIDYVKLYHDKMKKYPRLALFSDERELEAELREKIDPNQSPVSRQSFCCEDGDLIPPSTQSSSTAAFATRQENVTGDASRSSPTLASGATQRSGVRKASASPSTSSSRHIKHRKVKTVKTHLAPASRRINSVNHSNLPGVKAEEDEGNELYSVRTDAEGEIYQCRLCPNIHTRKMGDMRRHLQSRCHQPPSFPCIPECGKAFTRPDALRRHLKKSHVHDRLELDESGQRAVRKDYHMT
jgi:hypothetical protein